MSSGDSTTETSTHGITAGEGKLLAESIIFFETKDWSFKLGLEVLASIRLKGLP